MGFCALQFIIYHCRGGSGGRAIPPAAAGVAEKVPPECHWLLLPGHYESAFSGHVAVSQDRDYGATWVICGFTYHQTHRLHWGVFSSREEMDGYK